MRVLTAGNLYPPHHLGGYELLWQAAVRELRARGHEVRVLCADHREPGAGAEEDAGIHRELRWYWRDHDFPRMGAAERFAVERHNAAVWDRHVADFRPDVVSWWAMGGMSLGLIERARRAGLRGVGWVIDDWLIYGTDVDGWVRAWAVRPRAARLVDRWLPVAVDFAEARWVFCGEGIRESARRRRPELTDTAVEPLGVWPGFEERPAADWSWRLGYVGRIDERKGIGVAIEALARLPAEATLTVTGGGDAREAERLRELASALGVADRVTFAAPVARDRLTDVYAAADAIVFPVTWFEPFGLVPLEAMAVGRPVLASGQGGSADYLRDGENSLLHRPGDAASLAETVRRLASDATLRDRLRAGGRATAAELTERRWLEAVVREHEA